MATVSSLTKARMLAIEAASVVDGEVIGDELILTTHDGTVINAGNVRGPQGVDSRIPIVRYPIASASWTRLATINGVSAGAGGEIDILLSGLGDLGNIYRGTALIHVVQRGSNNIAVRGWSWGFDEATEPLTLYTKQISSLVFEVWVRLSAYTMRAEVDVLASWNAVLNNDLFQNSLPAGLTVQPIDRANYKPATPAVAQIGTDQNSFVTPEGLRSAREFFTATVAATYGAGAVTVLLDNGSTVSISGVMTNDNIRASDSVYVQRVLNGNYYITGKYASLPQGGYANLSGGSTPYQPWDARGWNPYEPSKDTGKILDPYSAFVVHRSGSGVVTLTGLGVSKTLAANAVIAVLPMGFRPSVYHRFKCVVNGAPYFVEVRPDGQIITLTAIASGLYMSLSNIMFHAAGQDLTWTTITTFLNSFSASTVGTFGDAAYAQDTYGDVWLRGLVTKAATVATDNYGIFTLPVGMRVTLEHHLNAYHNNAAYRFLGAAAATGVVHNKSGWTGGNIAGLSGIVLSPTARDAQWTRFNGNGPAGNSFAYQNSWTDFNAASFTPGAFLRRPDGLVLLRGLIGAGVVGAGVAKIAPGFMPMGRLTREQPSNSASGRMDMSALALNGTDGFAEIVSSAGSNAWLSLDGVAWQSYH